MRILIASHEPWDDAPVGRRVGQLASQLAAAGHQVRLLVVDSGELAGGRAASLSAGVSLRHAVCRAGDTTAMVPFAAPRFVAASEHQSFARLTDQQVDQYRDQLRTVFDDEIQEFNPHLVHAEHVWLLGHLALEAGVPYVVEAWGAELELLAVDKRWLRYARETAENAGRILVPNNDVAQQLHQTFPGLETEVTLTSRDDVNTPAGRDKLLDVYRAVVRARCGDVPLD
ncbi:MAG: glycosyltransferase [Planctomycetes bacterium]|nr:glycosyltransferase [Planctomycetota bacterium]